MIKMKKTSFIFEFSSYNLRFVFYNGRGYILKSLIEEPICGQKISLFWKIVDFKDWIELGFIG